MDTMKPNREGCHFSGVIREGGKSIDVDILELFELRNFRLFEFTGCRSTLDRRKMG